MRLTNRTLDQIHSPIGAAFALLPLASGTKPLLDMSQAAPSYPTAPVIANKIAAIAHDPNGGRYCPQEGLPELREVFAAELSADYSGDVQPENVLVTAGCNQAFCLLASAIAEPGDEIILPTPFYFNHDMWLRLDGIEPVHLEPADGLEPTVAEAKELLTERTRAVVLVSPGNPTGFIISPETLAAFADFAVRNDLLLIVDETYRSFRGTAEPAHRLYSNDGWADHVATLHSFSKDLAIPGYRVGAVVGHPDLLAETMKLLDCIAICAPRIGQEAVITGLRDATEWRAQQAARIGDAQKVFESVMATEPGGFVLEASGAYFGWVRHPFADEPTSSVIRRLVAELDILAIPGDAFTPTDQRFLRMSFANLSPDQLIELGSRLETMRPIGVET